MSLAPDLSSPRLVAAVQRLTAAGIATARSDAAALEAHSARSGGLDFEQLVELRARRVPLSHLVGETTFRGLALSTGPGVFTPQPETSSLVQWVVDAVGAVPHQLVVDLCTGAGTVALSLAHELDRPTVHAVERDEEAVRWTRINAERRARAGDAPTQVHLADAATCLPSLDGLVDVVVSNPPYVATHETAIPDPEVLEHDPAIALWAGDDGLDVIRMVERSAARLLKPGGVVAVEHSDRQGLSAPKLFENAHWKQVRDHLDHDGLPRFVTAVRTEGVVAHPKG
ncbi:MAG: N5-glutamine S-adenosyl-L-methionine-dependent methyltransferase [Frankiales bacterium]|nr:N5-glutamine S-adenosyl-L-methionine-dependent methyltransferase [Frankiales bacterium]